MLTDEEVVLMRRVMADALTIKPGERAVELVVGRLPALSPIVVEEPWVFDKFTGEWMCGAASWYGRSIHQTDGDDRVTVFSQGVLKLDANDVCPILLDFDEKFVTDSMEKVVRACWYRDYNTMRQVGIHHANDKGQQSRVLRDEEEEDEELVDFDIEWVTPVYVVAEPIAQPGMVVFEQPDDDHVMEELRRIARGERDQYHINMLNDAADALRAERARWRAEND